MVLKLDHKQKQFHYKDRMKLAKSQTAGKSIYPVADETSAWKLASGFQQSQKSLQPLSLNLNKEPFNLVQFKDKKEIG